MVALVVEVAFEMSVKLVDEINHVDYNDAHWLCTAIKLQQKYKIQIICVYDNNISKFHYKNALDKKRFTLESKDDDIGEYVEWRIVVPVESAIELEDGWGSARTNGIMLVDSVAEAKIENGFIKMEPTGITNQK